MLLKIAAENPDVTEKNNAATSQEKPVDLLPDLEYDEDFAALLTTDGNKLENCVL